MNATGHIEYDHSDLRRIYSAAIHIVSNYQSVHHSLILSDKRTDGIVKARRIAICAVLRATGCSYAALARVAGMHHTTVMDADRSHGATDEALEIANLLDISRGVKTEKEPFWMQMARANNWHGPGDCQHGDDLHGGEL